MTSNANTSGLEVVAKLADHLRSFEHHTVGSLRIDMNEVRNVIVACDFAASAQAAIDAEKARADRLAGALRRSREGWANALELRLLPPQHDHTATILRDEADAALQQEPTT